MEAKGHFTDDEYWAVMISLGMDKALYSLRDEGDEITDQTHVSRRRAVIISHPGFLAQRREQRAELERTMADDAATKAAKATKRAAAEAGKVERAEARAEKQRLKV